MAKKQFKAESKRLLDLMINSIYTNKEIFLREILSNASDAIDKLCYLSLTDDQVGLDRGDFRIDILVDRDARTITVRDNGIGMTLQEAEANLGVIARSGSYQFKGEMDKEQAGEDISIIGFDGSRDCTKPVPPLASVHQDNEQRAKKAVELLVSMMQNPDFRESICIPVTLQKGGSAGKCRRIGT